MGLFGSGAHWPLYWLVRCLGRGVLFEGRSIWRSRGFSHLRSASPACGAPRFHRATPTSPCSKADWCRLSHTRDSIIRNRHGRGQCPSADAWRCHRWRLLGSRYFANTYGESSIQVGRNRRIRSCFSGINCGYQLSTTTTTATFKGNAFQLSTLPQPFRVGERERLALVNRREAATL